MCHLKVCLSVAVYVLLFCPFKKHRLFSKAELTQHSLPHPYPALFRAVNFIIGVLRQNLASLAQGESSGHSLGIASARLSTRWSVFSSKPVVSHSDIPEVATCPPVVLPKVREENLWTPYQELIFKHNWHSLKKQERWTQMVV